MEGNIHEIIGKNIKRLRTKKAISQEKLSMVMKKNDKFIGHIERCERRISLNSLISLAEYFEVDIKEFFK